MSRKRDMRNWSERRAWEAMAQGWADQIRTFEGGSLQNLKTITERIHDALGEVSASLGLHAGSVTGYEGGAWFDPAGYASTFIYGAGIEGILGAAFPASALVDATQPIERLRSVLTGHEVGRLRLACSVAGAAFLETKPPCGRGFAGKRNRQPAAGQANGGRSWRG